MALVGCSGVQQFAAGDLANAAALAQKGNDQVGAMCWTGLEAAAAATPNPTADGLATLAERKRLTGEVIAGACGSVLAPVLLQDLGKIVPAPFNLALPF